jgi:hypothetical protein
MTEGLLFDLPPKPPDVQKLELGGSACRTDESKVVLAGVKGTVATSRANKARLTRRGSCRYLTKGGVWPASARSDAT